MRRRAFQAGVARLGEPVRSGIQADQIGSFLSATGWHGRDLTAGDDDVLPRRVAAGFIVADKS
jgi:hypothetical protein